MATFSLVVPTVGRTEELASLFASLDAQGPARIELIVVDQNEDDRVSALLQALPPGISCLHLRLAFKNVSRARNVGLAHAKGEFVAFPDDDCWYPAGLLPGIERWFAAHPAYQILATGAVDEDGIPSGNRWPQDRCDIRPINSLRTTFCNSLFFRRAPLPSSVRFSEGLFPGEETDYVLHLLKRGLRGRFDRSLSVQHPRRDMLSGTVTRKRAVRYGSAMGQLVRRHSLFMLWTMLLGYDLARALLVSVRGRTADAVFCFAHAEGLFRGFVWPNAQVGAGER